MSIDETADMPSVPKSGPVVRTARRRRVLVFRAATACLLALCSLAAWLYGAPATLRLELIVDSRDTVEVFWASAGQQYHADRSDSRRVTSFDETYELTVPGLPRTRKLRIDPTRSARELTIRALTISQFGFGETRLEGASLARLTPRKDIAEVSLQPGGLVVRTDGTDGQLELTLSPALDPVAVGVLVCASLIAAFALLYGIDLVRRYPAASLSLCWLASAGLLLVHVAAWWVDQHNTLAHNDRWIAGKDTGKFLFQTYDFLSRPLDGNGVPLARDMGFQEILYAEPDGPQRRLAALGAQILLEPNAYLWIELVRAGQRLQAVRLSRRDGYDSGWYVFDHAGRLQEKQVLDFAWPAGTRWLDVEVRATEGRWQLLVDGVGLGQVARITEPGARFGFRGSAAGHDVYVRAIDMEFENPLDPSRRWRESEDWSTDDAWRRALPWAALFAFALLALRWLRQETLARWLEPARRPRYRLADSLLLLVALAVSWLFSPTDPAPLAALAAAELFSLVSFFLLHDAGDPHPPSMRSPMQAAYVAGIVAIIGAGGSVWLQAWSDPQQITRRSLQGVDPALYRLVPAPSQAPTDYHATTTVTVQPGEPFFVPGAFNAQSLEFDVRLPAGRTLDVVWQQQSFLTRGDPDGEALPLQRRLLRLSAREGVASGLASDTGVRPMPLYALDAPVRPGQRNRVAIESGPRGVVVTLNGTSTRFDGLGLLGTGRTGFLTWDGALNVDEIRVRPIGLDRRTAPLLALLPFVAPLLLGLACWLLLRPAGRVPLAPTVFLACAACFPVAALAGAGLFLAGPGLARLGDVAVGWWWICASAVAISLLHLLVAWRARLSGLALYYNALVLLCVMALGAFTWERLPAGHPLKLRFADDALAPGNVVGDGAGDGPWYASNEAIVTNTFFWNQRFTGESATTSKPPGTLRVFVLGGSQAWGSGAASSAETFAELLEDRLSRRGHPVEVLNNGVNAAGLESILRTSRELLLQFAPDVVVLDVGTNDSGGLRMIRPRARQADYLAYLLGMFEDYVADFQARGIELVLNLEAVCAETIDEFHPEPRLYAGLAAIAERRGVPVVRPLSVTARLERDHLLWWDIAHLTPVGQSVMADLLAGPVAGAIRRRLDRLAAH